MEKFIKFLKYWLPVILWAGLIFYLSSLSGLKSDLTVFWDVFWRKLAHAGEFGVLSGLLFRALRGYEVGFKKALTWSFVLAIVYAVSDELHQYFVPLRECRLKDMGIDSAGVTLVACLLLLINYKK